MTLTLTPAVLALSLVSAPAFAQAPAAAPPPLAATASAGLALTSGNKDTSTLNLGYELAYDPKTRNVIKSDGLYLRGKTDGALTADRLALNGRDEFRLHDRAYTFGQVQFLQDQFKNIDYLVAPAAGLGYRLVDAARTRLLVDGGLGGVWEKPMLGDVRSSGAVTLGEKFTHQISASATISQSVTALYKTRDFGDALYTFGASLTAAVTPRTQLKVEVLDIYKSLVIPGIEKNDVALIVGMVFKR
ncbi:MAG: YdiY family protein [Vicinamibacterales bacterium]